ncbi:uncharacterized protein LOC131145896 [Malania oleifera]|uniref:uncharacterized protein LOC131145896 n=1 Tax=Malania oleifera TaxID=397392 RepID=UPI0025AEAE37|nr:uncharacterized protein LOC131145896 [Malania oleifera]
MAEPPDTLIEEREELMVSPSGGDPTLRIAHFLKPSVDGSVPELLPQFLSASGISLSEPRKYHPKVDFNGWRLQPRKWEIWVDRMCSLHQSTWKRAAIYEAILGSNCDILRCDDLVFGVAEKWCPLTNTFVFPWGEATITLEDVIVLGGYSVLGDPVSRTTEFEEIERKLIEARRELLRSRSKKATQSGWLKLFTEREREFEHEAFISLWLSRFVFPGFPKDSVPEYVFPIAIHLARGTRLALAPFVLATLYRDLSLLKGSISDAAKSDSDNFSLSVALWAPLQLVQVWAWERFPILRPMPNAIERGKPRLARWDKVTRSEVGDVRLALDCARESFLWRPYATKVMNWSLPEFYREKEEWVLIDDNLDEELQSLCRCLRVSELVGLNSIEQYLPHRVAMQFGLDQDLPIHVTRFNDSPEITWTSYSKLVGGAKLYVPPRLFESDVTTRYLEWWKGSFATQNVANNGFMRLNISLNCRNRSPMKSKTVKLEYPIVKEETDDHTGVSPGFSPESKMAKVKYFIDEQKDDRLDVLGVSPKSKVAKVKCSIDEQKDDLLNVPARFSRKSKRMEAEESIGKNESTLVEKLDDEEGHIKEDRLTVAELLKYNYRHKRVGNGQGGNKHSASACSPSSWLSSSSRLARSVARRTKPLMKSVEEIIRSEVAIGGADSAVEDACEADNLVHNILSNNGKEEENGSCIVLEKPGLELEARISKLEKIVSSLKARACDRFERNLL